MSLLERRPRVVRSKTMDAFSRVPLSQLDPDGSGNVRDSVLTQSTDHQTASSSIYPRSSSMSSECYSPVSEDEDVHSEHEEPQKIDSDDVSYRLRLLVNNNYFLPPAHAKPRPSDFPPPAPPKKNSAPAFLDIFRVGKSKSKPPTPISGDFDALTPALRTTSDATVVSGFPVSKSPSSGPHSPASEVSLGRVVVVREKMVDLARAAKQAEDEVNAVRGIRRDGSQRDHQQVPFDDVIDPTDIVDVPPPSSRYPFAIQASNIHGLGVQDSVGAALLADRLPPPSSPDNSASPEGDWRTALLKAAVGHSFDNLANAAEQSPSSPIMKPGSPSTFRTDTPTSRILDKRIISNPILESAQESPAPSPAPGSPDSVLPNQTKDSDSQPSSYVFRRAETPAAPLTPLNPPPRKQMPNPLYSLSQTDLTDLTEPLASPTTSLYPMSSVPVLESDVRHAMMMTPPPGPVFASANTSTSSGAFTPEPTMYSSLDDEHEELPRPSTSMSDSDTDSYPSPTASAFQDALTGLTPVHSPTEMVQQEEENQASASANRDTDNARHSTDERPPSARSAHRPSPLVFKRSITSSPPPRVSSSLARPSFFEPLTAPPRTTSLHYGSLNNPINPNLRTSPIPSRLGVNLADDGDGGNDGDDDGVQDIEVQSTPKLQPVSSSSHPPSPNNLFLDIRAPDPVTPPLPVLSVSASSPGPSSPSFNNAPPNGSPPSSHDSPQSNSDAIGSASSTPNSRPLSLSQRRGNPALTNLTIPSSTVPSIKSAPAVGAPSFPGGGGNGRARVGSGASRGMEALRHGVDGSRFGGNLRVEMAPSSPVSFFDSIQNQPNAMDDLESSEEDSDEDDMSSMTSDSSLSGRRHLEDAHSFSQFSSTPLSPVHPHYALSSQATQRGSTHSQIPMYGAGRSVRPEGSEGVSGSGFGISTGASMLMRLGNHSTPYFSPSSSIKSNTASPSQSRSPLYSSSNSPLSTHPYANSSLSLNHKSSSRSNLNLTSHSMMPPPSPTPSQFSFKDRSLDNPDFRPKEHIAKPKTQPEFLKDVAKGKSKGVGLKSVGIGLGITGKGRDRSKSIGEQGSRVEGGKKDKGKGKEPSLPPPASFNFYQRPQNRGLHGSASFEYPRSQSSLAGGYGNLGASGGGKRRPATTETSSPSTSASPSAAASAMASPLVSPTWAPSYTQPGQTQSFSGLGPATSGIGGQQAVALAKAKAEARERDQESMRKLDGLLIQHMEAEKNRMRKIAKSVASSGSGKT